MSSKAHSLFKDADTFDFFTVFLVFVCCHVPVTVYCVPMNVQVFCRSVLTEALCLHFLYFCVHLYSFHSLVYLPFMTFFLLYHNWLSCTLSGESLYTFWRIPVHSFWLFSVCFIILLTKVLK